MVGGKLERKGEVWGCVAERLTWAKCEPFMNMHPLHLERGNINIYEGEGAVGGRGRYLLDDRRVEAVKAAVQPDALREKKNADDSRNVHTLGKQVQAGPRDKIF